MALIAAVDESWSRDGMFCMAGYLATSQDWESFSRDWRKLLPASSIQTDGSFRFKMSEMYASIERRQRIPWFRKVTKRHVSYGFAVVFNMSELASARNRIYVPDLLINFGFTESPYQYAMKVFLDSISSRKPELDELFKEAQVQPHDGEGIEFVFDETTEKTEIISGWNAYAASRSTSARSFFNGQPQFKPDDDFLPLQAADGLAWEVRNKFSAQPLDAYLDEDFKPGEQIPVMTLYKTEKDITQDLANAVAAGIEDGRQVYIIGEGL
ncbi:MAG: DUF3800 domain-containing protein [Pseudomonadota bacterium]